MKYNPNLHNEVTTRRPPAVSLMRLMGLLLAIASMLLATLALIQNQGIVSIVLAAIVCLLGLRIFALWLGATQAPALSPSSHPSTIPTPKLSEIPHKDVVPLTRSPYGITTEIARHPNEGLSYPPLQDYPRTLGRPALSQYHVYAPHQMLSQEVTLTPTAAWKSMTSTSSFPYTPIEQDSLFQFDIPITNERCFLLPREGEPLVECQDSYALHITPISRSYAVADGVAGSFVSGPWARIVAQNFVTRSDSFSGKDDFQHWLLGCSQQWHTWIEQRWIPTINILRERGGESPGNWSQEIHQGAQTTLLGCMISPSSQTGFSTSMTITIFGIGDCALFHFSPTLSGEWIVTTAFPFLSSNEFDSYPDTLVTADRPDLIERAWERKKLQSIQALHGDLLLLATDTLAKWLLTQVELQTKRWIPLLTITAHSEFEQYIRREFRRDQVEDDDLTMLVIPL